MHVHRAATCRIRTGLDTEQKWFGRDGGLIAAWESGREMSTHDPGLAERARAGELVILPWKGGVEKLLKNPHKFGTMRYLAMWQGLRGDDLEVDPDSESTLQCTATGMTVTYTSDPEKFAGPDSES